MIDSAFLPRLCTSGYNLSRHCVCYKGLVMCTPRTHNKPENYPCFFVIETDLLYLTHCDHLFAQVVLVFADCAVPASNGFVFADENVFGDFVEEAGEMRC